MKYNSVSDIIGPIMLGPSSSHTAGACRIGQIARSLYTTTPEEVQIIFYGSFAETYKGHGTDIAMVAGLLGLSTFDERIPQAWELAAENKMKVTITTSSDKVLHPNTARLLLKGHMGQTELVGVSIGGGNVRIIEVDGFRTHLDGNTAALFILHHDQAGVIAHVADVLAEHKINIGHMENSRKEKGQDALMVLETDERIKHDLRVALRAIDGVQQVIQIRQ